MGMKAYPEEVTSSIKVKLLDVLQNFSDELKSYVKCEGRS